MGRVWPENAVWKNVFTNDYGIGVAFSESPFDEDFLVAGTDDGLIQITEDGGATWRKVDSFPEMPTLIYVSCVVASRHDPDRIYALFNNHKRGDFTPYVLKSDDKGRSWSSIAGNLPYRQVAWDLVEDPENENLLFLGTELGLWMSLVGGEEWALMNADFGLPTIPVRDMEIHEGMGDLVIATFGRGFYVLDDYTPLRSMSKTVGERAGLYPVRDAYAFNPIRYYSAGSGAGAFTAQNPPFGAIFTYSLGESLPTGDAEMVFVVRETNGAVVAEVPAPNRAAWNRVTWDLRGLPESPEQGGGQGGRTRQGPLVNPGRYSVTLEARVGGEGSVLAGPETFWVRPLPDSVR